MMLGALHADWMYGTGVALPLDKQQVRWLQLLFDAIAVYSRNLTVMHTVQMNVMYKTDVALNLKAGWILRTFVMLCVWLHLRVLFVSLFYLCACAVLTSKIFQWGWWLCIDLHSLNVLCDGGFVLDKQDVRYIRIGACVTISPLFMCCQNKHIDDDGSVSSSFVECIAGRWCCVGTGQTGCTLHSHWCMCYNLAFMYVLPK